MDAGLGTFLGGIGGGIASGLFGQSSAREQMRFQEKMANSQYQRAAADLKKAGLNRVLALGNPASAPAGASATMPDLGSSFVGAFNARTQRDLSKAQAAAAEASAGKDNTQAMVNTVTAAKTAQETLNLEKQHQLLELEAGKQEVFKGLYGDLAPLMSALSGLVRDGAASLGNTAKSIPEKAAAVGTLTKLKAEGAAHSVKDFAGQNRRIFLDNAPLPLVSPLHKMLRYFEQKKALEKYVKEKK